MIEFNTAGQYVVWIEQDGHVFPCAHNTREDAQAMVDYVTAEKALTAKIVARPVCK